METVLLSITFFELPSIYEKAATFSLPITFNDIPKPGQ